MVLSPLPSDSHKIADRSRAELDDAVVLPCNDGSFACGAAEVASPMCEDSNRSDKFTAHSDQLIGYQVLDGPHPSDEIPPVGWASSGTVYISTIRMMVGDDHAQTVTATPSVITAGMPSATDTIQPRNGNTVSIVEGVLGDFLGLALATVLVLAILLIKTKRKLREEEAFRQHFSAARQDNHIAAVEPLKDSRIYEVEAIRPPAEMQSR